MHSCVKSTKLVTTDSRKKNLSECYTLKCKFISKIVLRISTYKSELLWSHSVMVLVMTEFFLCKNKLKHFWRLKYFVLTIVVLLLWPQKNQNGTNKTTIIWFFWTQNTFWFFWQQYIAAAQQITWINS